MRIYVAALCSLLGVGGAALAARPPDAKPPDARPVERRSAQPDTHREASDSGGVEEQESPRVLQDASQVTSGTLSVRSGRISYQAEAGVQVVYLKDPKDDDP